MNHMISPTSTVPAPVKLPVPLAVDTFKLSRAPEELVTVVFRLDDAERELGRFRAPLGVEDEGDREEMLAIHAEARKQLGKNPARIGSHLGSLS